RKNFIPPDAFPYKTPTGENYDTGEYGRTLTKALELADYSALREEQKRRRANPGLPFDELTNRPDEGDERPTAENGEPSSDVPRPSSLLGIGLACYVEMCGFGPYESATVRVEPTGTVTVFTGTSPHGQGGGTTFAQIV